MAGKKKKKPAANPARGFATTSVASKPKQDADVNPATESSSHEPDLTSGDTTSSMPAGINTHSQELNSKVTPEELEAQLEHDELQILVEKHAEKIRRESRRQVSRVQTDRRVLRTQAQSLTTRDWLPEELMSEIIDLAKEESSDANRRAQHLSLAKVVTEEDAVNKMWTLKLVLGDMGFSPDDIQQALRWLCNNSASVEADSNVWGFQELLEWLALHNQRNEHLSYGSPPALRVNEAHEGDLQPQSNNRAVASTTTRCMPPDSDITDVEISDLDSDLEPDELIPTYLKLKSQLYKNNPELVDSGIREIRKSKSRKSAPVARIPASAHKLQAQLHRIETDVLFEKDLADAQWVQQRHQLVQEIAANRKLEMRGPNAALSATKQEVVTQSESSPGPSSESNTLVDDSSIRDDDSLSDSGILGDIFTAIPNGTSTSKILESSMNAAQDIKLKDFGKQTGLSPRRILEEAVRGRDSEARLVFRVISPTTYACRHALTVTWSKQQAWSYETEISGVSCCVPEPSIEFRATDISAVSEQQSEGFISTAALFSIFANSAKDEKVYLRLPSNWRDLYKEFLDCKKDRVDAIDRATIKDLRSIFQDQIDQEESDGIVLTNKFRLRNQGSGQVSEAEDSGRDVIKPFKADEELKALWQCKSSTSSYQRMHRLRTNLPVYTFRQVILKTIEQHQVTIVCGETGCGKSTQIPSFLLEHELAQGKPCKIYCTEPRRISAISLAQRVSEELGEHKNELGTFKSLVGYAIRLETNTTAQTRLVYATVGIVLRMLESSRGLDEVTHLIIDEVHERSIDTDFLLIILRSLMLRRPELKVVLMSATVDAQRFSTYLDNAPILNVPGRTFPVQTKYLEDAIELTRYTSSTDKGFNDSDTSENEDAGQERTKSGVPNKLSGYSSATRNVLVSYDEYRIDYELIVRLIEFVAWDQVLGQYSKAFLVFLPGMAEIRQLNDMLSGHPSFNKDWYIHPLHSTISSEDQQAAFLIPPQGVRKIVLATNIAETGVTIPDITCVIDTGKHKEMRFDERRQLSRLTQSFISRANAKQRRGRAGRVQEGLCFHLFTRYRHDEMMAEQQTPEMLRLSLQDLVMRTKICKLGDIEQTLSEALDPPSSKNIRRAIDALIEVDALTGREDLTLLGRQLAKLPLDAHLGKLVLLSSIFSCVDVAITMAAILSSKSPFLTPMGARQRADAARLAFKKGDSDLLTTYNAYTSWKSVCSTPGQSEAQFCHKYFLSSQNFSNIEDLKGQLLTSLVDAGFIKLAPEERRALSRYRSSTRHRTFITIPDPYNSNCANDALVASVIAAAFYPKILIRDGKGWRNIANNQSVSLAPTSVNKGTKDSKYLSYYHILQSSNRFYNAHSTSIVYPLPMTLLAGSDIDFRIHAGVISLSGNALRFAVQNWRVCVALKILRHRIKDIVNATWKNPGRALSARETRWMNLFLRAFDAQKEKSDRLEKAKDLTAGKGK